MITNQANNNVPREAGDLKLTFTAVDSVMLGDFEPCEGRWDQDVIRASDFDLSEIQAEIERQIHAATGTKGSVQLFHANGHEITSENPGHGTFLATRTAIKQEAV